MSHPAMAGPTSARGVEAVACWAEAALAAKADFFPAVSGVLLICFGDYDYDSDNN
jgi:hypothetical protein